MKVTLYICLFVFTLGFANWSFASSDDVLSLYGNKIVGVTVGVEGGIQILTITVNESDVTLSSNPDASCHHKGNGQYYFAATGEHPLFKTFVALAAMSRTAKLPFVIDSVTGGGSCKMGLIGLR